MNLRNLGRVEGRILRLRPPYDTRVMGVSAASLSAATQRWLRSRFPIENGLEKFELAGVRGTFLEHLCRAVAMQERVELATIPCPELFELRNDASEFADEETLSEIDAACSPFVYNTTLSPELLLSSQSPPLEWWIEGEPWPPVIPPTHDTVAAVLHDRMSRHLRMWQTWYTITVLNPEGNPILRSDPGVTSGTYLVRRSSSS